MPIFYHSPKSQYSELLLANCFYGPAIQSLCWTTSFNFAFDPASAVSLVRPCRVPFKPECVCNVSGRHSFYFLRPCGVECLVATLGVDGPKTDDVLGQLVQGYSKGNVWLFSCNSFLHLGEEWLSTILLESSSRLSCLEYRVWGKYPELWRSHRKLQERRGNSWSMAISMRLLVNIAAVSWGSCSSTPVLTLCSFRGIFVQTVSSRPTKVASVLPWASPTSPINKFLPWTMVSFFSYKGYVAHQLVRCLSSAGHSRMRCPH